MIKKQNISQTTRIRRELFNLQKKSTKNLQLTYTYGEGNGTPLQYSCLENPWTEEPGGLQSMGSQRVGHD